MTRPRFNVLRHVRMQLKGGYIRYEPTEYQIMKSFPPITKTNNIERIVKPLNVPYAGLYKKAVSRNTSFSGDFVFGAYAHLEPQGLVMAKRQYKYMQEGLDEESAYQKALDYVGELENESYMKLKSVIDAVKATGTESPFLAEPEIAAEIAAWQAKTLETPYEDMELATQAELDFFLQTKVLKWNEVERERRMKDVAFFKQFEQLLTSLFPLSITHREAKMAAFKKETESVILDFHDVDPTFLNTAKPFLLDEYLDLLREVKAQPDLQQWSVEERERFSHWIVDKLAYGAGVIDKPAKEMQKYLDDVRDRFFPMIAMPFIAPTFKVPTMESVKAALYENKIGYRLEEDGKTFVRRFYRLPGLLFPEQLLLVQIATDKERLETALESSEALAHELQSADIPENRLADVTRNLERYRDYAATLPAAEEEISEMSVLDAILGDDNVRSSIESNGLKEEEEEEQSSALALSDEERRAMIEKYIRLPRNELEQDRFDFISLTEAIKLDAITDEHLAETLGDSIEQSVVLLQAKLQKKFDAKEAERRSKLWAKRGLWTDKEIATPLLQM